MANTETIVTKSAKASIDASTGLVNQPITGLIAGEDIANCDISQRNRVAALDCEFRRPSSFDRRKVNTPHPDRICIRRFCVALERHRNRFVRRRPSPYMHGKPSLDDHVIGKQSRQHNVGPRGEREDEHNCDGSKHEEPIIQQILRPCGCMIYYGTTAMETLRLVAPATSS